MSDPQLEFLFAAIACFASAGLLLAVIIPRLRNQPRPALVTAPIRLQPQPVHRSPRPVRTGLTAPQQIVPLALGVVQSIAPDAPTPFDGLVSSETVVTTRKLALPGTPQLIVPTTTSPVRVGDIG